MLEEVDCIKVDSQTHIDWIIVLSGLGCIDNLLDVIESESTENQNTSIEPDIEKSRAWIKDA